MREEARVDRGGGRGGDRPRAPRGSGDCPTEAGRQNGGGCRRRHLMALKFVTPADLSMDSTSTLSARQRRMDRYLLPRSSAAN